MKWYTCLNRHVLLWLGESLIIAAHSVLQNTTLEPHIVYDGEPNPLMEYLTGLGIQIHYHKNSFRHLIDSIHGLPGYDAEHAAGSWLPLDLPVIDDSNDVVLFTDPDVIFMSDPPKNITPKLLSAAGEYNFNKLPETNKGIFNSGVVYWNLNSMRKIRSLIINYAYENKFYWPGNGYDQMILSNLLSGLRDELPQSLNWRPFAKDLSNPIIIHMHAIKLPEIISQAILKKEPLFKFSKTVYNLAPSSYDIVSGIALRYLNEASAKAYEDLGNDYISTLSRIRSAGDIVPALQSCPNTTGTFNQGKAYLPDIFGEGYIEQFIDIINSYISSHPENKYNILEWGSGFTTNALINFLNMSNRKFEMYSFDNNNQYQRIISSYSYNGENIKFISMELGGPVRNESNNGYNYSSYPLKLDKLFDIVFINGRRRVECAFNASLIIHPGSIVILHDYQRNRYRSMLQLYDIIQETSQFRVMAIRQEIYAAYKKIKDKNHDILVFG